MAIGKKAQTKRQHVGLGSSQMSQGLPDDFDGQITKAVFAPTNYGGKREEYTLAALITIKPDDGEEFTQIYSAGDLAFFAPSQDGEEPVDVENGEGEDLEGYYVVPTGDRKMLASGSNFGFFVKHLEDAGFTGLAETASLEILEGVYAHFNQIELPKRSGIVVDDSKRKGPRTLLCITELKEAPKKSGKSAPKATAKAASKPNGRVKEEEPEEEEETMESRVGAVIVEALTEADDNTLPKSKLTQLVVKAFKDAKEKAAAVKLISDAAFLGSDEYGFSYDKKAATITLG